jgi:hypothetical protein
MHPQHGIHSQSHRKRETERVATLRSKSSPNKNDAENAERCGLCVLFLFKPWEMVDELFWTILFCRRTCDLSSIISIYSIGVQKSHRPRITTKCKTKCNACESSVYRPFSAWIRTPKKTWPYSTIKKKLVSTPRQSSSSVPEGTPQLQTPNCNHGICIVYENLPNKTR